MPSQFLPLIRHRLLQIAEGGAGAVNGVAAVGAGSGCDSQKYLRPLSAARNYCVSRCHSFTRAILAHSAPRTISRNAFRYDGRSTPFSQMAPLCPRAPGTATGRARRGQGCA
jgi:hypothetical protein